MKFKIGDVLKVAWVDASINHNALQLSELAESRPLPMASVGFLTSADTNRIIISMEQDTEQEKYKHNLIIPRAYITSVVRLKETKK